MSSVSTALLFSVQALFAANFPLSQIFSQLFPPKTSSCNGVNTETLVEGGANEMIILFAFFISILVPVFAGVPNFASQSLRFFFLFLILQCVL